MGNLRDKYTDEEWDDLGKRIKAEKEKELKKLFKKHGGKRPNAGRKSQYNEETQTISFRVPKSLIEPITKYVKRALAKSKK
jgi:hypothetical protein